MNIMPNTNAITTQLVNTDITTRQMTTEPTKAITEQIGSQKTVEANASAIKTGDEMIGSLLDIKA